MRTLEETNLLIDCGLGKEPCDVVLTNLKLVNVCSREVYDAKIFIKGKRIVFIHGKGEGVLRNRIVTELKQKYPRCNWQDASFQEYGFGATLVIIH